MASKRIFLGFSFCSVFVFELSACSRDQRRLHGRRKSITEGHWYIFLSLKVYFPDLLLFLTAFTWNQYLLLHSHPNGHVACMCMPSCFSHDQLFATPWTIAPQAPLSMAFSRREYWSGLPSPPSGIFPPQGSNLCLLWLLHWQAASVSLAPLGKPTMYHLRTHILKHDFS